MASQARYGACATRAALLSCTAVAASQTATIGPHHSAAAYSLRGGQPRSQASTALAAATRETGSATTISAIAAAPARTWPAARAAARTASRLTHRPITAPSPAVR